ncbi:phosphotransferase enzyme family protein [Microlunatus parietis]|uniref:Homoserine kinase type II n=1 Tax=Microlunatus parietis TaxID=682979 RepID=A0A7Y9I8W0_9ACTN|nr:phosphotransferase [Microlunatus parietis]NYE72491.1 homoserine kinase type II [Microlunatus parietis]
MITAPAPEMLWEASDPVAELSRRFGFATAEAAGRWATALLADEYGIALRSVDRLVLSAQNLMIWVTGADQRLMIKVCRFGGSHDWLLPRAALVDWLADRGQPVARPVRTVAGELQLRRDGWSIGIQPVLPGELLDGSDHDQVRAAGATLAALHEDLAAWPDRPTLHHDHRWGPDGPPDGRADFLAIPEHSAAAAPELTARLDGLAADLPDRPGRQPVHTDFRGANLLWHDGRIGAVLDFEEARLEAPVIDLAHALVLLGTWYRDWRPITPEAQQLFLAAYSDRRPLTDAEQAWLHPLVGAGMLRQGWLPDATRWLAPAP